MEPELIDHLVAVALAARQRQARAQVEATDAARAYREAFAALVAEEARREGAHGAQSRAARRMRISPTQAARLTADARRNLGNAV